MNLDCCCNDSELISSLKNELDSYKNEFEKLRDRINELIVPNQCDEEVHTSLLQNETKFQTYKQISTDAINNLKEQIVYINIEKTTYYNLWKISQQTISNLEIEINQYLKKSQNIDVIQQLTTKMDTSQKQVAHLERDIEHEKASKAKLEQSKSICEAKMNALDNKYKVLQDEHKELLEQLKCMQNVYDTNRIELLDLKKERDEYKQKLMVICEHVKNCQTRETIAYSKIENAIQMAEAAIVEKNAAFQREQEIREECDQLALTIGRVMEEAGDKFEHNISEIKSSYSKRMTKMEDIIQKLIIIKETFAKGNQKTKVQIQALQSTLNQVTRTNESINNDLQIASKTIVELEMKLDAYEKFIACEQAASKESEDRSQQLQILLDNNTKLKQQWRNTFEEITKKLQQEVIELQRENSRLITENHKLNKELRRNKI